MNRLNEILKEQGRTQAFLSREMNKSVNTINNWCKNSTQPSLIEAQHLANILGCEISELVEKTKKEVKK